MVSRRDLILSSVPIGLALSTDAAATKANSPTDGGVIQNQHGPVMTEEDFADVAPGEMARRTSDGDWRGVAADARPQVPVNEDGEMTVEEWTYYIDAGRFAKLTTGDVEANTRLEWSARNTGVEGNDITLALVDPGMSNQNLSVSVNGSDVRVSLATDGNGDIRNTANHVINGIILHDEAKHMLVPHNAGGSDGQGIVEPVDPPLSLSGGEDAGGDDDNDGLSPETAKATFEGVERVLPRTIIGDFEVRFLGDYSLGINPKGRWIDGKITFRGDTDEPAEHEIRRIFLSSHICAGWRGVEFNNLRIKNHRGFGNFFRSCLGVHVNGVEFRGARSPGAIRARNSIIVVENCDFGNVTVRDAIWSEFGSNVYSVNNTGTAVRNGLRAIRSGMIGKNGEQPSGRSGDELTVNGMIFGGNETIDDIATGDDASAAANAEAINEILERLRGHGALSG